MQPSEIIIFAAAKASSVSSQSQTMKASRPPRNSGECAPATLCVPVCVCVCQEFILSFSSALSRSLSAVESASCTIR